MTNQNVPGQTAKFLPFFRKYGKYLILALLLLGLGAGIWFSTRPAYVPPNYPDAILDAMDLDGSRFMTIPEHYPYVIRELEPGKTPAEKIGFQPIADQLPVFRYAVDRQGMDPSVTQNYLERVMPQLITVLNTKVPDYTVDSLLGFANFNFSGYHAEVDLNENSIGVTMLIEKSTAESKKHPIALNGIDVVADKNWSDKKLLQEISWVKDELLKIYHIDVPDSLIKRTDDCITITYNNMDSHYTNPYRDHPLGSYLTLTFTPSKEDNAKYNLSSFFVDEYLISPNEIYEQYGMENSISLREAKKYLQNGYVLGDHVCKKCEDWEKYAPILDYDQVGLTYMFDLGVSGYTVPFYVFSKQLSSSEKYDEYLCVYVPAVELKNWVEYTQSFPIGHD